MHVLVIKTSSLGDVVHTLPALTDAAKMIPNIRFDWAVEEAFSEIPSWHPAVEKVIPIAIRRWRKDPVGSLLGTEWKRCKQSLRKGHYDAVIDAQGLLKSAWLARFVRAPRYGYDRDSVRERWATLAYHHQFSVPKEMHAVERIRDLFSQVFKYKLPETQGEYSLDQKKFKSSGQLTSSLVFLHGTARDEKLWPESHWKALTKMATSNGYEVLLPWGNSSEQERAKRIASVNASAHILPKLNLRGLATTLLNASGVVGVDTGLGHLAAAFDVPNVSLYGPTYPSLVGTYGKQQVHLQSKKVNKKGESPAALMAEISPEIVWANLSTIAQRAK
jgi:heptosyltransferase-1